MKIKYSFLILLIFTFVQITTAQISANWKLTGPIKFPTNKSGQVNGMGRVTQIVFHPTNSKKIYATSGSGGLFISIDGGSNWQVAPGTDKLPSMSCASVCVDHTNDNILYLGGGDPNYYNRGYGISKSTDGGNSFQLSNNGIGNRMALNLLMDPSNNKILIAATDSGIYKTTNAGVTWTEKKSGGDFKQMIAKPNDAKTLYAVTSSTFYRSTDMGDTWTAVTLSGANSGGGRIGVSKADPNRVYVTFVGDYKAGKATPIYKSTNAGVTFTTVKPANGYNLNGYDEKDSGQGDYNYGMTVDPTNADNVWICGHCIFRSTDGGANWSRKTSWAVEMHTDMHQLAYSPYDASQLLNANDGGVWKNDDAGAGVKWIPFSDGLTSTECYHAGQSPIKKDRISAGLQDNGEVYYDATTWYTNRGGDWGPLIAFDYQNANMVYYLNAGAGERRVGMTGGSQNLSLPFTPSETSIIEFTSLKPNVAFIGANNIWRTDNLSTDPPVWKKISSFNEEIKSIGISPVDANVVYAITSSGKVFRSDNALGTAPSFANVSTLPTVPSSKASIAVIKAASNVIYISSNSKVYRSDNKGATWTSVSTGLPATNFIKLQHDQFSKDESICIANGMGGVYYKNKNLSSWVNYSKGLPTICNLVDFMIYNDGNYKNSVLRVAYYGRGVWETLLYDPSTSTGEIIDDGVFSLNIFPNPSQESANVSFTLSQVGNAELSIYDMSGKLVNVVVTQKLSEGTYTYPIDISTLGSGSYLCKLNVNGVVTSRILVKE
jgi:photosystem II stability/assembly factor-like uncharacterized protein